MPRKILPRKIFSVILLTALAALRSPGASDPSRYAPFGDGQVHYESYGSGHDAVVFIHGWTCDLTFWRGQEPVYRNHRSILIDLPGHGLSDKPNVAYPPEFFARGIEAVLLDAGVDHAVLVAHSLGGQIAFSFTRQFPDQVKGLVLVETEVIATPRNSKARAGQQELYRKRAQGFSGPAGTLNFLGLVESMFSPKTTPALREEIRSKMLATPEYVRIAAEAGTPELDAPPAGEKIDLPALAIQVAQNGTDQRAAALRTILPNLRLEKWERSGHFLMMEDPTRFNQSLEKFLAGLF